MFVNSFVVVSGEESLPKEEERICYDENS